MKGFIMIHMPSIKGVYWDKIIKFKDRILDFFGSDEMESILFSDCMGEINRLRSIFIDLNENIIKELPEAWKESIYDGLKKILAIRWGDFLKAMEKLGDPAHTPSQTRTSPLYCADSVFPIALPERGLSAMGAPALIACSMFAAFLYAASPNGLSSEAPPEIVGQQSGNVALTAPIAHTETGAHGRRHRAQKWHESPVVGVPVLLSMTLAAFWAMMGLPTRGKDGTWIERLSETEHNGPAPYIFIPIDYVLARVAGCSKPAAVCVADLNCGVATREMTGLEYS